MAVGREVTEAHYLHERSGLEAVLRPPVKQPTALRWVPRREELLAATQEGELISVDPVLGTRVVTDGLGETAVLDVHADQKRYLAVCRNGTWRVGTLNGQTLLNGEHAFVGGMGGFLADRYAVIVGDEHGVRVMRIIALSDGSTTGHVRLPPKVVGTVSIEGRPLLARSTAAGLKVIPLGKDHSFPADLDSTAHRLRPSGQYVLGFTSTGVCVWGQEGGVPRSMRLPDLTAGDISKDGQYLGLGTKNGAVALARMDRMEKRIRPDLVRAFTDPVTSVSFSTKGRWLATGAEGLRIWSWED
ncbi:MAG: WD40 repeat domain-containing protein [Myxococcota bacterium]